MWGLNRVRLQLSAQAIRFTVLSEKLPPSTGNAQNNRHVSRLPDVSEVNVATCNHIYGTWWLLFVRQAWNVGGELSRNKRSKSHFYARKLWRKWTARQSHIPSKKDWTFYILMECVTKILLLYTDAASRILAVSPLTWCFICLRMCYVMLIVDCQRIHRVSQLLLFIAFSTVFTIICLKQTTFLGYIM